MELLKCLYVTFRFYSWLCGRRDIEMRPLIIVGKAVVQAIGTWIIERRCVFFNTYSKILWPNRRHFHRHHIVVTVVVVGIVDIV